MCKTIIVIASILGSIPISAIYGEYIKQPLLDKMASSGPNELIRINIMMKEQADEPYLRGLCKGKSKSTRRALVISYLKEISERTQSDLLAYLKDRESQNEVSNITPLWIINAISCEAISSVIEGIAGRAAVKSVDWDKLQKVGLNQMQEKASFVKKPVPADVLSEIVWNVEKIRAPQVWDQGYTGQDIIVGVLDSGVNYNHDDLKDHIWTNSDEIPNNNIDDDGNGYTDDYYGYDFFRDDPDPMDEGHHGTHVAGTIAGDGTALIQTGVAPDARIMCLKIADGQTFTTEGLVWEGIQYALANGAEVINLSYGWRHYDPDNPNYQPPDRGEWRTLCNSVLAAELIMSVSAGNSRNWPVPPYPPPDNINTPGDVPPPWLHPDQILEGGVNAVMTVGATDEDDEIAFFSSYGPVSWQNIGPWFDYPYDPEIGLIDPDVTAPGYCIHEPTGHGYIVSLHPSDNSSYENSLPGTSVACPHNAGLIALMLSKNPTLLPWEIDSIIETTALDLGSPGKDNDYGAGRIDALDAVNATRLELLSTNPLATYPNQVRHLRVTPDPRPIFPPITNRFISYQSDNGVYIACSPINERPNIIRVDDGEFPCMVVFSTPSLTEGYYGITYLQNNFPYVKFLTPNGWRKYPFPNPVQNPSSVYPVSAIGGKLHALHPLNNLNGAGVFQVVKNNISYLCFVYLAYDPQTDDIVLIEASTIAQIPGYTSSLNPCIGITPGSPYDYFHVVWQGPDQRIYYKIRENDGTWTATVPVLTEIDRSYPFVEAYGDSVWAAWVKPSVGNTDIYRTARSINDPISSWRQILDEISQSPGGQAYSQWPVLSSGYFAVWSEEPPVNWETFYWKKFPEDEEPERGNLSGPNSPDFSLYPNSDWHTELYIGPNGEEFVKLHSIWTEGNESPYTIPFVSKSWTRYGGGWPPPYSLHALTSAPQDTTTDFLVYYKVETGGRTPSPYCKRRENSINDKLFIPGDYGDTLIYELPYLDPSKYYLSKIVLTMLGGDSSPQKARLKFGNVKDTIIDIDQRNPEALYVFIPQEAYENTKVEIKIEKITRNKVVLKDFTLYQFDVITEKEKMTTTAIFAGKNDILKSLSLNVGSNPISSRALIHYELPTDEKTSIKIYEVTGRLLKTIVDANLTPGKYNITWNLTDENGRKVPAGTYFVKMDTRNRSIVRKITVLK